MFVVMSTVSNPGMGFLKAHNSFLAVLAAFFLATDGSSEAFELRQFLLEKPRIGDVFSVGCREKMFEPHINPNSRFPVLFSVYIGEHTGQNNKPFSSFSFDHCCLDCPFNFPMCFASDFADMLNTELFIQSDAVAVCWKFNRRKTTPGFESRIAGLFSSFDSSKEVLEGFIKSTHSCLGAAEVKLGKPFVVCSCLLKPCRLLCIFDACFVLFPRIPFLGKAVVIEPPMSFQHGFKFAALSAVREKSEFIRPAHSLPLLVGYIFLNAFFSDAANRGNKITSTPQGRQSTLQGWEFFSQNPRSKAFKSVGNFSRAPARVCFNKQVNVVRHDFQCVNCRFHFGRFLSQENSKPIVHRRGQYCPSVFRAPNQVVLQRKNRSCIFCISRIHFINIYRPCIYASRNSKKIGAASSAS